ncbi:MAG: sirohydrochlorin cobaltochelatase [Desulfovibrio sp.]|nr:sirohydrochlorin cobaltochelatase [Desulfovibrio sp.]
MPRTLSHFGLRPLLFVLLLLAALNLCGTSHAAENTEPKQGILLAAFGTSVPEAQPAFTAVDAEFKKAFPGAPVVWAYTSQIIRKKLAEQGRPVGGISDGLAQLAKDGVKVVRVQSLHVLAGEEFTALERAVLLDVSKNPGRFEAVFMGRPLLESKADAKELLAVIEADTKSARGKNSALVLMGHGQSHGRADLAFEGVCAVFKAGDKNIHMATVEGARNFDDMLKNLKAARIKHVVVAPLMMVAGDHARNDLAGDEDDSWANQLKAAGIKVDAHLKGLGETPGAAAILVRHAKESTDDLTKEPKKP